MRQNLAVPRPGRGCVLIAANQQYGHLDIRQQGPVIHVTNRRAASGISDWVCVQQYGANRFRDRIGGGQRAGGEEALHHGFFDGAHSLFEDGSEAGVEEAWIGHARRCVGKDELSHALSRMDAEPLADHSAQGEAAEGKMVMVGGVHCRQDVIGKLRDRVIAGRGVGSAVASQIQPQHLKSREEVRHLRIPHAVIRAQRVGQNQQRAAG